MFHPGWHCLLRACWQITFKFLNKICLLISPLPSLLIDRLPCQNSVKFLIENGKSKTFFTINNSCAFNFKLYSISFILESLFFFAKHFFIPKLFLIEHLRSVLSHLFFQFLKPLPDGVYLFKTMETWYCEIWLKHKNDVSDVVLVSLLTTSEVCVLRTQFQLGSKYTFETLNRFYFDYLTLIWLSYLRIFYQFHEHIYSNISKIYFEKKIQTIWYLRLTGHILEI